MFKKRLLASIVLDKKKLELNEKGSCHIETFPTKNILTVEEHEELTRCLNRSCDLLRKSYILKSSNKDRKYF